MGMRMPFPALLFLVLTITANTVLTQDLPCRDPSQTRCPENGQCQLTCDKDTTVVKDEAPCTDQTQTRCPDTKQCQQSCDKVTTTDDTITGILVVTKLILVDSPAQFTLKDLMASWKTATGNTGITGTMVKVNCPADSTVEVQAIKDGSALTKDMVISVQDNIKILKISGGKTNQDEKSVFRCRVTTEPDDTTKAPVMTFALVAVIAPPLPPTEVLLKNITLQKEDELTPLSVYDFLTVKRPRFMDITGIVKSLEEDIEDDIKSSPAVVRLKERLKDKLKEYHDETKALELSFTQEPTHVDLTLTIKDDTSKGTERKSFTGGKISIGRIGIKTLVIAAKPMSLTGVITLSVSAFSNHVIISDEQTITIKVIKVDHRPFLIARNPLFLPSRSNSHEFQCGEVVSGVFHDKNKDDTLKCAILFAQSTAAGNWQLQKTDSSWENVRVMDPNTIKGARDLLVTMLSVHDKLRFRSNFSDPMTPPEAVRKTSLYLLATDGNDAQTSRQRKLTVNQCTDSVLGLCFTHTAFSARPLQAYVSPKCLTNCDKTMVCGKPISAEACPACPKGQQQNECTKKCYGKDDTVTRKEGKDCRGQCDTSSYTLYPVPGGQPLCLRTGLTIEEVNQQICRKVNKGDMNSCQKCYGGNTTKTEKEGMDKCGICDGDGSCENSCAGVPNGPEIMDSCGQCLDPTSSNFNKKLGSGIQPGRILPNKVAAIGKRIFHIIGCNFDKSMQSPTCKLIKGDTEVQLLSKFDKKPLSLMMGIMPVYRSALLVTGDMTGVDPGDYALHCMRGPTKLPEISGITVLPAPTGLTITPYLIETNEETDMNVCGSGLDTDTGTLQCAMKCPFPKGSSRAKICVYRHRYLTMDASISRQGCVKCHSNAAFKMATSVPGKIQLVVLLEKQMLLSFNDLSKAELTVIGNPPTLQLVTFDGYCKLTLTFDRSVSGEVNPRKLFIPPINGKGKFSRNKFLVKFDRGQAVMPDDQFAVPQDMLWQTNSLQGNKNGNAHFIVTIPAIETTPTMRIISTSSAILSECERAKLSIEYKGFGSCINLDVTWSVAIADGAVDASFTDRVQRAGRVLNIKKDDLHPGNIYTITARMTSPPLLEATYTIKRESITKGIEVKIKQIHDPNPTKGIEVRARVTEIFCGTRIARQEVIKYQYVLKGHTGEDIYFNGDESSSKFVLHPGLLIGGRQYTISVTVYRGEDTATDSISVKVRLRNLKMKIIYDSAVDVNKEVTLTAQVKDPNNNPGPPVFTWECYMIRTTDVALCPKSLTDIFDAATTKTLTIIPGSLKVENTYNLTVTAYLGQQIKRKFAIVKGVGGSPPKIKLRAKITKVLVYTSVRMAIRVSSKDTVNITCSCSFSDNQGNIGDCDGFDIAEISLTGQDLARPIKKKIPFESPGLHTIECRAQSQSDQELVATASVTIEVLQPPTLGSATIDVTAGKSLNTTFTVNIQRETDDNSLCQLRYREENKGSWKKIGVPDSSTSHEFKLPAGQITVNRECCVDNFCANQALPQTIDVAEISQEEVEAIIAEITDKDKLIDAVTVAIDDLNDGSIANSNALKEKLKDAVSDVVKEVSDQIPSESFEKLDRVRAVLGVVRIEDDLKKELQDKVRVLLRGEQGSSRRKRDVSQDPILPITVTDAQTLLNTLKNIYKNVSEDDISKADGEQFVENLETIGYRLCANPASVGTGVAPVHLKTSDVLLKVHELSADIEGFAMIDHNMTCTDCPEFSNHTATVRYGESLTGELSLWNCTEVGELTCNSACFVTAAMKKDFRSAGMESSAKLEYNSSARASDIHLAKAYNPETYAELQVTPQGMNLTIIVDIHADDLMAYTLQCNAWVDQAWSVNPCMSGEPEMGSDGVYRVVCSCVGFGYFSVMKEPVDESVETTTNVVSTTSSSQSSTSASGSLTSASESSSSASESSTSASDSLTSPSESSSSASESSTSGSESSSSASESSTSGSESSTSGSESSSSASESSTSGSESSTSGSESSSSASESSTSGSESSTSGSESSSSASEISTSGSESSTSTSESSTSGSESSSSASESSTATSVSSTTTVTTTVTTVRSTADKEIKFKIGGSLSQLTQNSSLSDLKARLKTQIANHLAINENRIKNVDLTQATARRRKRATEFVIVTFVLVAASTPSEMSVTDLENQLRNDIFSSNFTLTDSNGNPFTVDPTFFNARSVTADPGPEKEKKHPLVPIVIGAVVGSLCLILLIVIIVVVVLKKKKKKDRLVSDTPSPPSTPSPSFSNGKQTRNPYAVGVSSSPLPEKPGADKSTGVIQQYYIVDKDRSPSTSTSRAISPKSTTDSHSRPRSDASLTREGSTTSHGGSNRSPTRDLPPIG